MSKIASEHKHFVMMESGEAIEGCEEQLVSYDTEEKVWNHIKESIKDYIEAGMEYSEDSFNVKPLTQYTKLRHGLTLTIEQEKYLKERREIPDIFNNFYWKAGDCGIMARVINELTKKPIIGVRGYNEEGDNVDGDEMVSHFVVKIGENQYADYLGVRSREEIIKDCVFSYPPEKISFELVDLRDIVLNTSNLNEGLSIAREFIRIYHPYLIQKYRS